jgi:uncharacterized membrane protein
MNIILQYISVLVPLTLLDMVWILGVAKSFYAKHMGFLFSDKINMLPVAFFYPLYALGLLLLAVMPAIANSSASEALWRGALLGLVSYGAYDLTNHATISGWPTVMTLVDMGWGMLVSALTSVIAYYIITSFK